MPSGLSPLTNLICFIIEPLSHYIRQDSLVKGVHIHGREHKLSLFADDILIYLGKNQSLTRIMTILEEFGSLSGKKLNIQKTQVMTTNPQLNKK